MMTPRILFVAALLVPGAAFADQAAGSACAAKLPADAQTIYNASVGQVTPQTDLRALITDQTKSLVMAGTIQRASAKPSAQAAAKCLELVK